MRSRFSLTTAAMAASLLALSACSSVQEPVRPNTLVAVKASAAPNLAAGAADPVWAQARGLSVPLSGGTNFVKGETTATLKAAYYGDTVYFLVQYADPTNSQRRGPYQKQADGSWKKLVDPANKGGDDNIYYEDKWAMLWPIGTVANFDKKGCAVACHIGEGKPYGNKYTRTPGEVMDMWHMKGARGATWGYVDDQYADATRYDPKTSPNAGRKSDAGNPGGDYTAIKLEGGKPAFMHKNGLPGNVSGFYYVKDGDQVPFDDSRFKAGDEVASYIANQLKGDRADIRVNASWKAGMHTSVVARKLVTGSKTDVQFNSLGGKYLFGFAAFDNAQVQHAMGDDTLTLIFAK
ncbi:MAG: ethylbenzene dehydrogenase-related protein [Rubrivivax sp.]|nr:ethylbenzene dehydrogenase-related protein [Rubrivivax sp.]